MSDRRFEEPDDALRQGLASLPVPELSGGFDERVLVELRRPAPWWTAFRALISWRELRPLASGAVCALVATVGLYAWSSRLPLNAPPHPVPGGDHSIVLERMLDSIDTGGLTFGPALGTTRPMERPVRAAPPKSPLHKTPGARSESRIARLQHA